CMAATEMLQPSLPFEAAAPRYEFVRHPRARRYVIRVVGDGTVRVTVPRWGSKREAEAFAARERAWIEKQQRRVEAERERRERERRNGGSASADAARIDETGDQQ